MEADRYLPVWNQLSPMMRSKLLAIGAALVAELDLDPLSAPMQAGDEEFRWDLNLTREGTLIAALEFTLFDGDVQDGEGFGLGLGLFGSEAQVLGGWYPGRYTDEAFTWDVDSLLRQLEQECQVDETATGLARMLRKFEDRHPR